MMSEYSDEAIAELELNKETLQDLDVEGSDVKGGAGTIVVAKPNSVVANPTIIGTIRAESLSGSGTSV
jgi:hypothetical protein